MMAAEEKNDSTPFTVQVALHPPVTDNNRNQLVTGDFISSSVCRYRAGTNEEETAAKYAKYLVERACPELWLMIMLRRARSPTGVVKLLYGDGYETTMVIGDANANGTPTVLAIGLSVNQKDATVGQIAASTWMPGVECIWNHVSRFVRDNSGVSPGVFIQTGNRKYMSPPMSAAEQQMKRNKYRVWPDPNNDNYIYRMEALEVDEQPTEIPASSPAPEPPKKKAPPKQSDKKKKESKAGETKKRSSSTTGENEADQPKKKKGKRDPTKPKRPTSLYVLYGNDHRARIVQANPGASLSEVNKMISEECKDLPEDTKKEYQAKIDADKERYNAEMEQWEAKKTAEKEDKDAETSDAAATRSEEEEGSADEERKSTSGSDTDDDEGSGVDDDETESKVSDKKPAKRPQGAKTAYSIFMSENSSKFREDNPDEDWPTVRGKITDAYHALEGSQKKKYDEMAKEDKERYEKDLAKWKEDGGGEDEATKKRKPKKVRDKNAPKRPLSNYFHFSLQNRARLMEENPGKGFGDIGKLVGEEFKKLSAEERKKYDDLAARDKERYKKEKDEYDAMLKRKAMEDALAEEKAEESEDSSYDGDKKPAAKPTKPAAAPPSPKHHKKKASKVPSAKKPPSDSNDESSAKDATHKKRSSSETTTKSSSEAAVAEQPPESSPKKRKKDSSPKRKKKKKKHRKSETSQKK